MSKEQTPEDERARKFSDAFSKNPETLDELTRACRNAMRAARNAPREEVKRPSRLARIRLRAAQLIAGYKYQN